MYRLKSVAAEQDKNFDIASFYPTWLKDYRIKMAFGPYLSYMSFGHMLQGGDIAWQGIEIWTKIAGLAGANSYFLKEFMLKLSFGG